ncbi:hypothetical protein ABMA28_004305 [Loxostege sticticalis]|uniref:Insulin-like domain-containing protein n=1 Tax=Loxostege sticticalis TaxID=481309 RepID=A0ABD0SQR0_LOXSC
MKLPLAIFLLMVSSAWLASGMSPAQVFCGRRLSNALANLCPTYNVGKRSGMDVLEDFVQESEWPWVMASRAKALKGKRSSPGVVTECCEKPCTPDELLSYC